MLKCVRGTLAINQLCVGTLSAGTASCTNPAGYDIYGRMDAHWAGNGTPSGRLADWLDPLGTGALTLAGCTSGDLIFADGFESGDFDHWGDVVSGASLR